MKIHGEKRDPEENPYGEKPYGENPSFSFCGQKPFAILGICGEDPYHIFFLSIEKSAKSVSLGAVVRD